MPNTATKATAPARASARLRAAPAAKPQPRAAAKPRAAIKPQPLVLSVVDIIGKKSCLFRDDAKKVFNRIHRAFKKQQPVEVSFHGTDMVVLSFMQVAIGALYKKYPEKEIRPLLKCTDMDKSAEVTLKAAVVRAKLYFADPVGYTARMKKVAQELRDEGYL